MRGQVQYSTEGPDPYAGQPKDKYGIPVAVVHEAQTGLPVWQYIHMLETPIQNAKIPDRPYTHICVLCAAEPPFRSSFKKIGVWRNALMRQRMTTNAVAHVQRVHPEEFVVIQDYKQRKREALVEKAAGNEEGQPKKKKAKKTPTLKKEATYKVEEPQKSEPTDVTQVTVSKTQSSVPAARKRPVGKTADLVKNWLISSGLPVSVLQDEALQHLLRLSTTAVSALPSASSLNAQVQDEFAKFASFLRSYLAAESQAAMDLPFLSLRYEFRPIAGAATEGEELTETVSSQQKAFLSLAVGFIDSQWRRVDLVLAAKEVPRGWDQQVNQLVTQTLSETYDGGVVNYARFIVDAEADSPSALAVGGGYESSTDDQEDLLTRTLRSCVVDALGIGNASSFGGETSVRRILRLLQELEKYFKAPDRAKALAEISASHGVADASHSASSMDELAASTLTSLGAVAELLRVSCTRYRAYWSYFQSPARPTVAEPELETAWTQLSVADWSTAAELEAIFNQLGQFRLEKRVAPRQGAVAPSYALLFRRLLSVTTDALSLKCLSLEDDYSSPIKRTARRKVKLVDTFTSTGRQCLGRLRQLIAQHFAGPSATNVDSEIKAMLLDPRISSKAGDIVKDKRAFRRAQEALREEHRIVFKLLANQQTGASPHSEEEDEDVDDDDEMSALLMVDGPKNQPPAASPTTGSGKRSRDAVVEDEARAWREWQQVYVAWDTVANEGADLFDKGQYNLLKLYHQVNILKWFRDVGQQSHPTASLLARVYLGQLPPPSPALGTSLLHFTEQEEAGWVSDVAGRAEKRCILHHNWQQYQELSSNAVLSTVGDDNIGIGSI
ncbi:hypothetical protein PRIC2_005718 [Phytophthora ramorum]